MKRKFIGEGTPAGDPGAESQWIPDETPDPLIDPSFILEQELDVIPTYCWSCGRVHGTEDCGLHNDDE